MARSTGEQIEIAADRTMPANRIGGTVEWSRLLLASSSVMVVTMAMLNFAPILPLVEREFGLTHAWSGALISATGIVHMVLTMPGGQITDAIGAKRSLVVAQLIIGFSILAGALAPGLELLFLSRVVLGLGTSLGFVAGLALVNSMSPPSQRARAQGIFGAGANAGVLLVLLATQPLSILGGWRGAFFAEGALALVVAVACALGLHPVARGDRADPGRWRDVLVRRPLYLLGIANAFTYGTFIGIAAWVTTLLWETRGLDLGVAASLSAAMALSAMAARILGGPFSIGREKAIMGLACLATAVCTAFVPVAPGIAVQVIALLAFGWFSNMSFGAIFGSAGRFSAQGAAGRSFGLVAFVANAAAAFFPPLIGYLLDVTSSFVLSFSLVAAGCLAGAIALAIWLPGNGHSRYSNPDIL